jgi:hypothetical protein
MIIMTTVVMMFYYGHCRMHTDWSISEKMFILMLLD